MYYQDICNLYGPDGYENGLIAENIGEWLQKYVGKKGDARHEHENFDWAWSLTTLLNTGPRVTARDWRGVYFKRAEDKLRFRLTFNV